MPTVQGDKNVENTPPTTSRDPSLGRDTRFDVFTYLGFRRVWVGFRCGFSKAWDGVPEREEPRKDVAMSAV